MQQRNDLRYKAGAHGPLIVCLQYLLAQNIRLRTVKAARPDRAREKEAGVGEGIGGGCPEREIVGV